MSQLSTTPKIRGFTYKLYVGEGQAQRVYKGEATYILGIVRYLQDQGGFHFEVAQQSEKIISIRTLRNRAATS